MTVAFRSILQGRHFYINQSFVLGEAEAAAAAGGYNTLTAHNSRSPASSTARPGRGSSGEAETTEAGRRGHQPRSLAQIVIMTMESSND